MYSRRSAFTDSQVAAFDAQELAQPASEAEPPIANGPPARHPLARRLTVGGLLLGAACSLAYGLTLALD